MKNPYRWDNLTSPQIKKLSEEGAIVLVPVGSTEQHGPHLPVGTDALMATSMSEKLAAALGEKGVPCVVAPTIAVANSTHHMSFAGSLTLRPETYLALLRDYCHSIASHGFRKILLVNGHGGNIDPTNTALISINEELGFPVYFTGYWQASAQAEQEILETQKGMIHACEEETSLVLALDDSLVDPIYKETKGNPGHGSSMLDAGVWETFHRMETHTENGVMGNSYAATKEKGEALTKRMVEDLAEKLADPSIWEQKV